MIRVSNKRYSILFLIALFCIIYNPPLFRVNSMHVVGIVSIVTLIINGSFKIQKKIFRLFIGFGIMLVYLFLISTISKKGDVGIIYSPIYFLLDIIPFSLVLSKHGQKKDYELSDYLKLFIIIAVIQAAISIIALLSPGIHTFLMNRFAAYGYGNVYMRISAFRMYGFAGGLTFATPVFQSIIAVIVLYQAVVYKKAWNYVLFILLFLSAVINARTSIIVVIIGFACLICFSKVSIKKKTLILVAEFLILLVIFGIGMPYIEQISPATYKWISEGIEEILAFVHGNRNQGYFSYINESTQYPLPDSLLKMIFGTGHDVFGAVSQKKFGISSDIGYVNDLWKGGIVYMSFLYMLIISIFNYLRKNGDEIICFLSFFMMILYPFIMIKGAIFNMCDPTNFAVILFIIVIESKYFNKEVTT